MSAMIRIPLKLTPTGKDILSRTAGGSPLVIDFAYWLLDGTRIDDAACDAMWNEGWIGVDAQLGNRKTFRVTDRGMKVLEAR